MLGTPGTYPPLGPKIYKHVVIQLLGSLFHKWEKEDQGAGRALASGFEPGLSRSAAYAQPFCPKSPMWKGPTEQWPFLPYLYHRVQGCLCGPRLAVVFHQASGHEAEATEQLMGASAGWHTWGICRGRAGREPKEALQRLQGAWPASVAGSGGVLGMGDSYINLQSRPCSGQGSWMPSPLVQLLYKSQ